MRNNTFFFVDPNRYWAMSLYEFGSALPIDTPVGSRYLGCYKDNRNERVLDRIMTTSSDMTPEVRDKKGLSYTRSGGRQQLYTMIKFSWCVLYFVLMYARVFHSGPRIASSSGIAKARQRCSLLTVPNTGSHSVAFEIYYCVSSSSSSLWNYHFSRPHMGGLVGRQSPQLH